MSDFSTFALFTAGLAIFAKGASAQQIPGGSNPSAGAVLTPTITDTLAVGTPFTITWDYKPAGCGEKIDLVLLKQVEGQTYVDFNSYIARNVDNSAKSYSWTPATSLAAGEKLYGIELVCVDTQAYQYTSRFSISNSGSGAVTTTAPVTTTSVAVTSSLSQYTSTASPSSYGGDYADDDEEEEDDDDHSSSTTAKHSTTSAPYPVTTGPAGNGTSPAKPTGTAPGTTTNFVTSTQPVTPPTSTPPRASGVAGAVQASFGGLAAAAAIAVFAL